MKKIYCLIVTFLLFSLSAFALEDIEYKNIEENTKIINTDSFWSLKVPKKSANYFIKKI